MIARLKGKLVEKKEHAVVLEQGGIFYEVMVPASVLSRIDAAVDASGDVTLVTHFYFQIGPSSGVPVLVGFLNEVERDFFLQFISVSGIGPKAAVRALDRSIAEIARAIGEGDAAALKELPGIGPQKAKEIVAKLQSKVSRFGLIQDGGVREERHDARPFEAEALSVLLQLQYKKAEAEEMIKKALERNKSIRSVEELLNELYKQKVRG
ncbi:MAG: Holliday junction branch migration protein RuvA [Candidatus Omnitrophica bacterium]|nr:Holliday junction branch migration protein RuvA [Candidatus Omnitrophota bacterium]